MSHLAPPLDDEQVMARLGAKIIRDQLEDLHEGGAPISDELMKGLNRRIRDGLYTFLHAARWRGRSISARRFLDRHEAGIPDYWEQPALDPYYRGNLEPEIDGAAAIPLVPSDQEHARAVGVVEGMLGRIAAGPNGGVLAGAAGAPLRQQLLHYGVCRFLKLAPEERDAQRHLAYLEHDLSERVRLGNRPPRGPMPWP